ncbi:MAG TPA: iron ABC transporter permease [Candidatus Sulfobium mesophilum]|jgi:iron complex transport system permease protein|nr:iron ABC transporter permease [Candidatus Sulfobium mesophilum]
MKIKLSLVAIIFWVVIVLSLCMGPTFINPFDLDETTKEIIINIRTPRTIVAALMGMALGASGAVLQGILRNPLADPYILGISSGASLTAALGIIGGLTFMGTFTIPALAFTGAIITGIIVGAMGWKRGGLWPERLLLAGVGISFLFSALLMLIMSVSRDEGMRRAMLWIFGDLSMSDWERVPYGISLILLGIIMSSFRAKALNALILGDDFAHSLGFTPQKERVLLFVSVGLMTGTSVSLGGMIGFIGLLVPHIVRFFIGADSRFLIPASALGGGALLCIADLLGRSLLSPMELPSGIVTAIIGSPYFLYLLRRKNVLSV